MGTRPRLTPHDPSTIDRLYAFYLQVHGAECSAQQICILHMAEACSRIGWLDRFEKGLCDQLSHNQEDCEEELDDLDWIANKRASYLRQFDRAFTRFAELRATRNPSELHLQQTGQERYPLPESTLLPRLTYSIRPHPSPDSAPQIPQ